MRLVRVGSCTVPCLRLLLLLAEIMLYGIAQKEQMGFDKAVEECSATMRRSNHTNVRTHAHAH